MSQNNGVIRIGRKGLKKFAFGDDGPVFEIDVVSTFQQWVIIDESFRPIEENSEGNKPIASIDMPRYHAEAQMFVRNLQGEKGIEVTVAEALDFIARLREQWLELISFFRTKLPEEPVSPATSEVHSELQFSVEEQAPK